MTTKSASGGCKDRREMNRIFLHPPDSACGEIVPLQRGSGQALFYGFKTRWDVENRTCDELQLEALAHYQTRDINGEEAKASFSY